MRASFTEEEFFQTFGRFDHDGDGLISEGELSIVTLSMIRLADSDVDGLINLTEYAEMKKQRKHKR